MVDGGWGLESREQGSGIWKVPSKLCYWVSMSQQFSTYD